MLNPFVRDKQGVLHVVALSGGHDSTAMAFLLREQNPDTPYNYVCTPTGNELPTMFDHKPIVWSFTMLDNFRTKCNYQAAERYVYKRTPYVESPEMKWGNDVHSAFEHRVAGGKILPVEMQHWESFATPFDGLRASTEPKLGVTREGTACDFFAKNVYGRGKIDVAVMQGENAFINDWKTGNGKYEDPFELEVGALLLQAKYPNLKNISGTYTWLKEGRVSKPYNLSNTQATWAEIGKIVASIQTQLQIGEFEKMKTPLCGWCNVACEHNTNPNFARP